MVFRFTNVFPHFFWSTEAAIIQLLTGPETDAQCDVIDKKEVIDKPKMAQFFKLTLKEIRAFYNQMH